MSAEDIAAGYKQLLEVDRGWRDMKSVLDLRPACHRLKERIRAHVILCWLTLLPLRVAENQADQTCPAMRRELQRIHIGTFTGPAGTFRQRTGIPKTARDLLAALNIDVPARSASSLRPRADLSPATSRRVETRPAADPTERSQAGLTGTPRRAPPSLLNISC